MHFGLRLQTIAAALQGMRILGIELNCPHCGDNRFNFPAALEDLVRCESCEGVLGTYAEVQARVADELARLASSRSARRGRWDTPQ